MKIELKEKPKNPIIIEGFPGYGLVSTIATGYLVDHLKARPIGKLWVKEMKPLAIIEDFKVIRPLQIFYSKKHNIVILQALTPVSSFEWQIADALIQICHELKAKELISIEGVGPATTGELKTFYFTTNADRKAAFEKMGIKPLGHGIILGVTAALLSRIPIGVPLSFIFAEAHSMLPDSRAASEIVKVLSAYLGIKIDYKPLIKEAEKFEDRVKSLIEKSTKAARAKRLRELTYLG